MVKVEMDGVVPISSDHLWKVLARHLDDEAITKIHSSVLHQRTISREGEKSYQGLKMSEITTVEREVRTSGRLWTCTWRITVSPPEEYSWEVLASSGVVAAGSYVKNTYSESPSGTRVLTVAEITPIGVPRLFHGWLVRRGLSRSDSEDVEYLKQIF